MNQDREKPAIRAATKLVALALLALSGCAKAAPSVPTKGPCQAWFDTEEKCNPEEKEPAGLVGSPLAGMLKQQCEQGMAHGGDPQISIEGVDARKLMACAEQAAGDCARYRACRLGHEVAQVLQDLDRAKRRKAWLKGEGICLRRTSLREDAKFVRVCDGFLSAALDDLTGEDDAFLAKSICGGKWYEQSAPLKSKCAEVLSKVGAPDGVKSAAKADPKDQRGSVDVDRAALTRPLPGQPVPGRVTLPGWSPVRRVFLLLDVFDMSWLESAPDLRGPVKEVTEYVVELEGDAMTRTLGEVLDHLGECPIEALFEQSRGRDPLSGEPVRCRDEYEIRASERYSYSPKGRVVGFQQLYSVTGTMRFGHTYAYDSAGRLTRNTETSHDPRLKSGDGTTVFRYDRAGNLAEVLIDKAPSSSWSKTLGPNVAVREPNRGEQGPTRYLYHHRYTKDSTVVEARRCTGPSACERRHVHTIRGNGRMVESVEFSRMCAHSDHRLVTRTTRREYDPQGRLVKRSGRNVEYDAHGDVVAKISRGDYGSVSSYSKHEYVRDGRGNWIAHLDNFYLIERDQERRILTLRRIVYH